VNNNTPEGFPDIMGNPIHIGDYLITVLNEYKRLEIAKVIGFTPKRMKIKVIAPNAHNDTTVHPDSARYLKISEQEVTLFLLKNSNKG